MSDLQPFLNRLRGLRDMAEGQASWLWAEVRTISPLKIRFEFVDTDFEGVPETLVTDLMVGDRVKCVLVGGRPLIVGRGQGGSRRFASVSALDAWQPEDGASAFLLSDGRHYVRVDGVWRPIQARHITDNASNGRAYFGTDDGPVGSGATYIGISPAVDSIANAFWINHDGSEVFRVYKAGGARVFGDLQVDGSVTQAGDTNWANLSIPGGSGTFRWRRYHGRIYVEYDVTLNTAVGAGVETSLTGVIPAGIRPSIALGVSVSGVGNRSMTGTINTLGNFWFRNNHTAAVTSFSGRADWFA